MPRTRVAMVTLACLGALLFGRPAPGADDGAPTCLPGGEAVKKAVEARRGKTELSKVALAMKPGTWAELKTDMPKRLWSAPPPSKGLHIGTWSDDAHWDSRTGQFLFFGVRQTRKFVAYSEETNAWRVIPFHEKDNAPELVQRYGHEYSINSLDPVRSRFYRAGSQYDIRKDTWAKSPAPGFRSMVFEYFTAMDALVSLERHRGVLWCCRNGDAKWTKLGKTPVHGYHSLARHNPWREEVLFAGGNGIRRVIVLRKDGTVKRMADFPLPVNTFTICMDILTVDPLSGRYLILSRRGGNQFVEFDSETNQYRLIDDFTTTPWPFHKSSPLVAYVPEYGVTMWADRKVHLYKHDASAKYPVVEPKPEPGKGK
ncbi:MAG: hypothetical protein R6V58_15960 [Planctomycetota bacterium]